MNPENGIVTKSANCTEEEAVNKIKSLLVIRGMPNDLIRNIAIIEALATEAAE